MVPLAFLPWLLPPPAGGARAEPGRPGSGAAVDAAIAELAAATTDAQRLDAARRLAGLGAPADRVVRALADALQQIDREQPNPTRVEIARLLAETGEDGVRQLAQATHAALTPEERADLLRVLGAQAIADPVVIRALIVSFLHAEDAAAKQDAIAGLLRIGRPAAGAMAERIADWPIEEDRRALADALTRIRSGAPAP